jgi:hypothetical protein
MVQRIKDIVWSAVIASGHNNRCNRVGVANDPRGCREGTTGGRKRASCFKGEHLLSKPDAKVKLAEFKALLYNEEDTAIRGFITKEGLATMLGEDAPAPGSIDKCADAIRRSSYSR